MDVWIIRGIIKTLFHQYSVGQIFIQKERTIVRSLTSSLNQNKREKILDRIGRLNNLFNH